jgi:hypothetical protein
MDAKGVALVADGCCIAHGSIQRAFVDDSSLLPDQCWKRGLTFRTVVMQTHLYLPLLRRLCLRLGGNAQLQLIRGQID